MKNSYFLLLIILLTTHSVRSQQFLCGTHVTDEQLEFVKSRLDINLRQADANSFSLIRVPITPHIIRQSNGTGGLSEAALTLAFVNVNDYYKNAGIEFFIPNNQINYIDDDALYDLNSSQEQAIGSANDVTGTINVYFSNSLQAGNPLCGYTYLPPSADRVFVVNSCIAGGTFEHELGHYFSLFHTHGTTNNGTTNELVNGTNCSSAGDFICDTPADPNLSGRVNASCQYTGNILDANGHLYSPDTDNIMSYAPGSCRDNFSIGQYQRIRNGFENGRSYLNIEATEFEARFNANLTYICEGDQVAFTHNTPLATSFQWTFQGGTPSVSFQANPKITYDTEGQYDVTLETFGGAGLYSILTVQAFVTIENPLVNSIDVTFQAPVTDAAAFSNDFDVTNDDLGITFAYSTLDRNADNTSGSVFIDNYNYITETYPNTDILITPTFDAAGIRAFTIDFDHAYAQRLADLSDTLTLVYRTDCDTEWNVIEKVGAAQLASVSQLVTTPFQPASPSDWAAYSHLFSLQDIDYSTIEIGLLQESYNGNNLYLDNISITPDFTVDAPFNFRVSSVDIEDFVFRWVDNSVNELNFVIEGSVDGVNYQQYATVPADATEYAISYVDLLDNFNWVRLYAAGKHGNVSAPTGPVDLNDVLSAGGEGNRHFSSRYYPSPFSDRLNIANMDGLLQHIRVFSIDGRLVEDVQPPPGISILQTGHWSTGSYIIELTYAENPRPEKRLMFKK